MKTKFINQFLSVTFLLLLISSCAKDDEFYELDKPAVFPYFSIDRMEAAAISMYANMSTPNGWWQNNIATSWIILNMAGDDNRWLALNTSNVDHVHLYFRNAAATTNSDCVHLWSGCFKAIGNINAVLDFYEANNGTPFLGKDGITDSYKKNVLRIKGEALSNTPNEHQANRTRHN